MVVAVIHRGAQVDRATAVLHGVIEELDTYRFSLHFPGRKGVAPDAFSSPRDISLRTSGRSPSVIVKFA